MSASAVKYGTHGVSGNNAKILMSFYHKFGANRSVSNKYNRYPNIDKSKSMFVPVTTMENEIAIKRNPTNNEFTINLKTGIIKELYTKQLITQKQMERAIILLNQKETVK